MLNQTFETRREIRKKLFLLKKNKNKKNVQIKTYHKHRKLNKFK